MIPVVTPTFNPGFFVAAAGRHAQGSLSEASEVFGILLFALMVVMLLGMFAFVWWDSRRPW